MHKALFKLYKTVWDEEREPNAWRNTKVIQIYKSANNKSDLDSIRHIHTKEDIVKVFQHLVTNEVKPIIEQNTSPFQIGAMPGHRSEEHLLTLKSVVSLVENNGEAVAIQLLDLVKYFDSEILVDVLGELYKGNIRGKLYRLLYEMNRKTRITVKTAVGESKPRETEENVSQGSVDGAVISSSSLAKGVEDFFSSSRMEMYFDCLKLLPQSFQDDLLQLNMDLIGLKIWQNQKVLNTILPKP